MYGSFFAARECKLIDRYRPRTPCRSEMAVFESVEGWYNSRRRNSALDMMSPIEYESNQPGVYRDTIPGLVAFTSTR